MSNSPESSETERFAGRKYGKGLERSNFAQTCSLLSQYLKEKRSFGDLSREMTGKLEAKEKSETFWPSATAMNLLSPNMEKSGEISRQNDVASPNVKSMDFFPQCASFGSSSSVEDAVTKSDFRKPATAEPETAQMTIFYAGQVLVFNDVPADKATEIMLLASKGSSHNSSGFLSTSGQDKIINSSSFVASGSNIISKSGTNSPQEHLQHQPQPIDSDLRIARRSSLNRFFEKRKDRVTARAPYQINNPSSPPKPEESKSWIDLEAQPSKQLELKL